MIELRWLERKIYESSTWYRTETRLQYRAMKLVDGCFNPKDCWTEWMDVPTERMAT